MGRKPIIFSPSRRGRRTKAAPKAAEFLILPVLIFGQGVLVWEAFKVIWATPRGRLVLSGIVLSIVALFVLKIRQKIKHRAFLQAQQHFLDSEIAKVQISDKRFDYFIDHGDYRRGNPKENLYRKSFLLSLLDVFGNRCAKCSSNDNGLDIDHFFLSKNEGGNFILRHTSGHLVNNAIPLCQPCNRSKSDKSYRDFFSKPEILYLLQKNALMTKKLNESPVLNSDGSVIKKNKKVA